MHHLLLLLSLGSGTDLTELHRELKIEAVRVEGAITIDGDLNEPEWERAQPATNFIQRIPRTGEPATERTEVRLLYDDQSLYVGVFCFDSAGAAGVMVNDITKDFYTLDSDGFQIVLDTFDDDRNSFLFGTNPKGGRFDMQIGADGNAGNTDWDGIWYVKTRITDGGWQVEMAIPFKTLRFRKLEEQIWGVNFERRVRRKFEDSYWAPLPAPYRLGRVSVAGTLAGLEGLKQGRNLYLKPYVSTPVVKRRQDEVDFQPDAGLDLKYGVSSQLTLDLTANTDFSQVEADEEQINLTRFSLFFPEKREFFLENAGIFEFGRRPRRYAQSFLNQRPDLIPFFSRRIGISEEGRLIPIHGGARFSGRTGPYTLGLLSMQSADFEDIPSTNFSVFRLRRDLFRKSDIGGIFVNKQESGGDFNRTYGVDANLSFFNYLDITSFLVKTETPGLAGDDQAADLEISWRDQFFDFYVGQLWMGEHFRPEAGFAPRTGMRKTSGRFMLTPRPQERVSWLRELQPTFNVDYITDPGGMLETRRMENRFSVIFADSSFLSFARESSFERLETPFRIRTHQAIPVGDYWFDQYSAYFQTDRSRMVSLEGTASTGRFYDGNRDAYGMGVSFQPSYQFAALLSWTHNDIDLPTGDFETELLTTRLNYSFTTQMFLNALIQYNSQEREISTNVRFNFMFKPLTDFYLVYNERRSTNGLGPERALIAKLTYMFSF